MRMWCACVLAWSAVLMSAVTGAAPATLGVNGRSNEQVMLASQGNIVVATWSATGPSGTDVFAAMSRDGGRTFGPPTRVNAVSGQVNGGGEQPPRVVLVPSPAGPKVVVVWTAKTSAGTRLVRAESVDGGRTFGATATVPGSEAAGNRGWESTAVTPEGRVLALWLDHRKLAGAAPAMVHQHGAQPGEAAPMPAPATPAAGPVERAEQSQLFFGSVDGVLPARALTGGVCYCCKTALVTAGQMVYGAWRHVYPGNERDIAVAASTDGGRTFGAPVRVSHDRWHIDGCPENGPALAVDRSGALHVMWPTLVKEKGTEVLALFHAISTDGRGFTPRVRLPAEGSTYHVQLVVDRDGALVAAWDETSPQGRRVIVARGRRMPAGGTTWTRLTVTDDTKGVYPALAATPSGVVVAWVRRDGDRSSIAVIRLDS